MSDSKKTSGLKDRRIIVTGGAGFLGMHVCDALQKFSPEDVFVPRSADHDLRSPVAVKDMLEKKKPHVVLHLAAVVGGIGANRNNPGRYFYDNATMAIHLMEESRLAGVEKFISAGTICSYPKHTPVPFREEDLWNGYPEETNAPYGLAKKMLLIQGQAYREQYGFNAITLLPVNLYGPYDNFDPDSSHVIPALVKKALEAREEGRESIEVWGSGQASREFLFVRDAAEAIAIAADKYNEAEPVNIGSGHEITIRELVSLICELCEFKGDIRWDSSKPDGQPRRCLDTSRARDAFGFEASTSLREGLIETIAWYEQQHLKKSQQRPQLSIAKPKVVDQNGSSKSANGSNGNGNGHAHGNGNGNGHVNGNGNGNGKGKSAINALFRNSKSQKLHEFKANEPASASRPKCALITGITGQDGSYLAELLLKKGYDVHGLVRRSSTFGTERIDHLYEDPQVPHKQLFLHYGDLTDAQNVMNVVLDNEPDEIYNLGAQSHVRVSFDLPSYTVDSVAMGTLHILEAARQLNKRKEVRVYQASSSEMYGDVVESPQTEKTPFRPQSPYACAKVFAHYQTINYRNAYNLFASNGILFNHESPRRGETFVTRKITRSAARIKLGLEDKLFLGNLDANRDWGYAKDYVEAMWLMLQHDEPDDFVVATGVTCSVRNFLEYVFEELDLDVEKHVEIDSRYFRPTEVNELLGDYSKAREKLKWEPDTNVEELARIMIKYDLQKATRELFGKEQWAKRTIGSPSGSLGSSVVEGSS